MNVHDGELAIASILAEIEAETGDWVEGVEIADSDVTRLADQRQQLLADCYGAAEAQAGLAVGWQVKNGRPDAWRRWGRYRPRRGEERIKLRA